MANGAANPDDEDFRSRYATETAGMPSTLATAAAGNLAVNDATTAKVNATGRLTALPGVGSPYSTPQTDQTNLNVASAMDRADLGNRFGFGSPQYQGGSEAAPVSPTLASAAINDIAQRRQEIDDQKRQIQAKLGMIPPQQAGFAAIALAPPKEHPELLHQLGSLEDESQSLLREQQNNSVAAARAEHENFARTLHAQASNGMAKILNKISAIQAPMGSDEHTLAAMNILGDTTDPEIAAARGTPGFDKILGPYAAQATKSALTAERIKQATDNFRSATGLEPDSIETTATGGINIRTGSTEAAQSAADKELNNAYGIRLTNLLNPQSVRVVATPSSTDKGDTQGNFVEVKTLAKGVPTTVYMPKADYLKYGGKLAADSMPAQPNTQPTATATFSPQDQAAINWASANPNDARAVAINRLHGIK